MNRKPVESRNIRSIGHDGKATLEIQFRNGSVYQYFDVPPHVFQQLLNPPGGSVGRFFNQHVKGHYRYVRL